MNVNISLNDASWLRAFIARIENYAQQFDQKCNEVCTRLAEIGKDVLDATYAAAAYAGTNDISVSLEPMEGGCRLSARGSVLGFIEFGTGISYPLGDYAGQVGAPPHGTYGKGKGNQPSWVYVGDPGNLGTVMHYGKKGAVVRTSGNPPANAFPAAAEAMRANFEQVVREVFEV